MIYMNKCKYLVMVFLLSLFTNISFVRADCTNEEIAKLKDEASKIKVTYEHLGEVTNDIGDVFYDRFNVEITNVGNDIILEINDLGEYSSDKDGKVKLELTTGDNIINVYSSKCNIKLDEIKVKLPTFNPYSLDPLCKGVDSSEFSLCKKYYKPSVTYSEFVKRVKSYRVTNKIKDNNNGNDIDNTNIFTKIISYVVKYKYYAIGIGSVLIVTPIVIVSVKKRRNRGVLK